MELSDTIEIVGGPRTPSWAIWFLVLAVPIACISALVSIVAAGVVAPLFEFTPVIVLGIALMARRWEGSSRGWLRATAIFAVIMAVEFVVWEGWFLHALNTPGALGAGFLGTNVMDVAPLYYLFELCVLLILLGVASVRSIVGIRRRTALARSRSSSATAVESAMPNKGIVSATLPPRDA